MLGDGRNELRSNKDHNERAPLRMQKPELAALLSAFSTTRYRYPLQSSIRSAQLDSTMSRPSPPYASKLFMHPLDFQWQSSSANR